MVGEGGVGINLKEYFKYNVCVHIYNVDTEKRVIVNMYSSDDT